MIIPHTDEWAGMFGTEVLVHVIIEGTPVMVMSL